MLRSAGSRLRGNDGRERGNDGGCAGLLSCFTLTLTLSHRGRGDVAPGTGPLGSRLRGNDAGCEGEGRVRGFAAKGLPPTYGCHLRTGRLAAVASSSRVFGSVCGAWTICSFDDQEGHAGSSFCSTRPISRCAIGR